uniref:DNA polymerase n=1 Tax=Panulirus argus virus 1 TaxID=380624 RepID=A0A6G9HDJ8_9VIRU|nr:family B DNA polymerase [Panulirus argus virus 1]
MKVFVYYAFAKKGEIHLHAVNDDGDKVTIVCPFVPHYYQGPLLPETVTEEEDIILRRRGRNGAVAVEKKRRFFGHVGYDWFVKKKRWSVKGRLNDGGGGAERVYESEISPLLQFQSFIDHSIFLDTFDVECAPTTTTTGGGANAFRCDDATKIRKTGDDRSGVPVKCMFFDIETYCTATTTEIIQISMRFASGGGGGDNDDLGATNVVLITKGATKCMERDFDGEKERFSLLSCKDEAELLVRFYEHVVREKPVFMIGYNIYMFDVKQIIDRTVACGLTEFECAGRTCTISHVVQTFYNDIATVSFMKKHSAFGRYDYTMSIDKSVSIDLFKFIKDNFNLSCYKLGDVSKYFLGDLNKVDMSYDEMRVNYERGEKIEDIAWYCLVDSILVHKLFAKLFVFLSLKSTCNITCTDASSLLMGGMSVKIFNMIYIYLKKRDVILNYEENMERNGSFVISGGHVLDPMIGHYNNVVCLDFNSLYPSIIIAYNLCPTTYITPAEARVLGPDSYHRIEADGTFHHFLRATVLEGLLPTLVEQLLRDRKETKKRMASAVGMDKIVLDKKQTAIKLMANSVYGVMASCVTKKAIGFEPVAASITAVGRQSVLKAKKHLDALLARKRAGHVFYGDTDSCYVALTDKTLSVDDCKAIGGRLEKEINELGIFPPPMYLSLEDDVHRHYILLAKKRYLFTSTKSPGIKSKGTLLARRTQCRVVRDVYMNTINRIVEGDSCDRTIRFVRKELKTLPERPLDDFVCTVSVNHNVATETGQVALYKRMKERKETLPVHRLQYIVVARNKLVYETKYFVEKNGLRVCYEYYRDALTNPLRQLLLVVFHLKLTVGEFNTLVGNNAKITDYFSRT